MLVIIIPVLIVLIIGGLFIGATKLRAQDSNTIEKIENTLKQRKTKPINLPDKNSTIKIPLGSTLSYSHAVHGSVGYGYHLDYNKTEFAIDYSYKYDNPEAVELGMCGADSAKQTCIIKPLKKGKFTIKVVHTFRGQTERIITYKIVVK